MWTSPRRMEADRKSQQWKFCAMKGTEALRSNWRYVSGTRRAKDEQGVITGLRTLLGSNAKNYFQLGWKFKKKIKKHSAGRGGSTGKPMGGIGQMNENKDRGHRVIFYPPCVCFERALTFTFLHGAEKMPLDSLASTILRILDPQVKRTKVASCLPFAKVLDWPFLGHVVKGVECVIRLLLVTRHLCGPGRTGWSAWPAAPPGFLEGREEIPHVESVP